MEVVARNLLCAYPELLAHVFKGRISAPRGKVVVESPDQVMWTLARPQEWGLLIPGRRLNPYFALAEVVWMWSGKGGAEFITYYNKSIGQFLDQGIPYFNAAYGKRVRHYGYSELPFRETPFPKTNGQLPEAVEVDQLDHVIRKLQADPDTRQAAVTLWDPIKDNFHTSKDYPCNNMLYFSQRDGKLNLTVVIRSNDLVWGTPYNMIQFSHLQALIAGSLELEIGTYTTMCNNLHVYNDLYPDTRKLVQDWSNEPHNLYQSSLFNDLPDMRWPLAHFDKFVRTVWERTEKDCRAAQEKYTSGTHHRSGPHGADLMVTRHKLHDAFDKHGVPEYWRQLFMTMFLFHVRKAKQPKLYEQIVDEFHTLLFWLVKDFNNEFVPESVTV